MDELDNNAPIDAPEVETAPVDTPDDGEQQTAPEPTEAEQAEAEAQAKADAEAKRQAAIDKRIGKEVAKRNEAERRATELEQRLAKLEQASTPTKEPDLADFESIADWQTAMRDYAKSQAQAEATSQAKQQAEQQTYAARAAVVKQQAVAVREQYSDFDDRLTAIAPFVEGFPPELEAAVMDSENAALLMYELGGDQVDLADLLDMPLHKALMKIGAIDARLKTSPPEPKTAKVSNAPAPIKPVSANAPAKRDVYSMSDREFLAANGLR